MPFLAADIGGTHARVALMRASHDGTRGIETLAYRVFACAEFSMLSELLQAFVDADVRVPVKHCVLACAGQVMGNEVVNDNLAWPIHLTQLRHALGLDEVALLNDFEALAYALDSSLAEDAHHLCGPDTHSRGTTLVIGPGTGLGAAAYVPGPAGGFVLTSEAGQMDFAPNSVREREILAYLAPNGGYVAFEQIVSGPGLLTVYAT
ncbi:MAG: glucokinase, partial [Rhodanobacter sp.]